MTGIDKASLKLIAEGVAGSAFLTLTHTGVTYFVGKKVAPSIFSSFGRTYGILYLLRLTRAKLELPEDYKARVKAHSARIKAESK